MGARRRSLEEGSGPSKHSGDASQRFSCALSFLLTQQPDKTRVYGVCPIDGIEIYRSSSHTYPNGNGFFHWLQPTCERHPSTPVDRVLESQQSIEDIISSTSARGLPGEQDSAAMLSCYEERNDGIDNLAGYAQQSTFTLTPVTFNGSANKGRIGPAYRDFIRKAIGVLRGRIRRQAIAISARQIRRFIR